MALGCDGNRQRNYVWKSLEDLGGCHCCLFLRGDLRKRLIEKNVTVVLAGGGLRDGFLGGGELTGQLCAIPTVSFPGGEDYDREHDRKYCFCKAQPNSSRHI